MAATYDIETLVEEAVVSILAQDGLNAERWEDTKNVNLSPVVKVKATASDEEVGTINTYLATRVMIDIACFTAKKRDVKGLISNNNRGLVRHAFAQSDIVDRLNAYSPNLSVYENGAYPQGSFDASDDAHYGKGTTFMVVALTI